MVNRLLNRQEREERLENPENRRIIGAYKKAEVDRLDREVFSSLERDYPSLNEFLERVRMDGYGPVESTKENEAKIKLLERLLGLVLLDDSDIKNASSQEANNFVERFNLTETSYDGSTQAQRNRRFEIKPTNKDIYPQKIGDLVMRLDLVKTSYNRLIPAQEQFYVDLAPAVKKVSSQEGVGIRTTVEDLQYMDRVSRIVIPTRDEAELFLERTQNFEIGLMNVCRDILAFGKESRGVGGIKSIPGQKEIRELERRIWDYKMKEFDRVYS